ncbi:DUF5590 domain-containing protein [Bacillus luteolus]|uniref:DUF5590 domain-containing protein n=1 Tax=Litchfieldia luteola TaxID=682179 RepID=A0ABR9QP15_9BACI|nr:DUF5590 domain-containing protein [Cytobacillus luteolus]MBE4910250.1 DUF5590 domain-containing protein [Cytobacillus luteolus]MBP1942178.1 uncharacterized protein YpmB [Cytobacillus luteolus]
MKKWIFLSILILVIGFWQAISVYITAMEPKREIEQQAIEIARAQANIHTIYEVTTYYGSESYQVVQGISDENVPLIVWIAENSDEIVIKRQDEGLRKEDVVNRLVSERNPQEIRSVRLGMEKNIPLWEVIYLNENNRLTYYYSDFETGDLLKRTTP